MTPIPTKEMGFPHLSVSLWQCSLPSATFLCGKVHVVVETIIYSFGAVLNICYYYVLNRLLTNAHVVRFSGQTFSALSS
jgi:hypothetical protein